METGVSPAVPPGCARGGGSSGAWKLCPGQGSAGRGEQRLEGLEHRGEGAVGAERRGQGILRAGRVSKAVGWEGRVGRRARGLTEYLGLKMPEIWFLRVSSVVALLRSCSWGET